MNETSTCSISVNGEHRRVAAGTTGAALGQEVGFDPGRGAGERDLGGVSRPLLGGGQVEDGDDYEIVHFVGGG